MIIKNLKTLGVEIRKMSPKMVMIVIVISVVFLILFITVVKIPPGTVYTLVLEHSINISHNIESSSLPRISAYGNNAYVVWEDNTDAGNSDIYFKAIKVHGGLTFGNAINLSHDAGFSSSPQISAYGNNAYVVWEDNSNGHSDIYFKATKNSGTTFGNAINLSHDAGFSSSPRIATSGNDVYVVWEDNSNGHSDIYFKPIRVRGTTFGNAINLSHDAGFSSSPQVVISIHNIYVLWTDNTAAGNSDIYFKRVIWRLTNLLTSI
jgi:hypothetical protein